MLKAAPATDWSVQTLHARIPNPHTRMIQEGEREADQS